MESENPFRCPEASQVRVFIKMALSIGLRIVAEGVEQEAQVKKLQSIGAEVIQGYYYDRPMPEEKMRERLKDPHYSK